VSQNQTVILGQIIEASTAEFLTTLKTVLLAPTDSVEISIGLQAPVDIPVGLVNTSETVLDLLNQLVGLGVITAPSVVSVSVVRSVRRLH